MQMREALIFFILTGMKSTTLIGCSSHFKSLMFKINRASEIAFSHAKPGWKNTSLSRPSHLTLVPGPREKALIQLLHIRGEQQWMKTTLHWKLSFLSNYKRFFYKITYQIKAKKIKYLSWFCFHQDLPDEDFECRNDRLRWCETIQWCATCRVANQNSFVHTLVYGRRTAQEMGGYTRKVRKLKTILGHCQSLKWFAPCHCAPPFNHIYRLLPIDRKTTARTTLPDTPCSS